MHEGDTETAQATSPLFLVFFDTTMENWNHAMAEGKYSSSRRSRVSPCMHSSKRVDQAANLARYAVDFTGVSRVEYISTPVQNLDEAVRLINQALVILPGNT